MIISNSEQLSPEWYAERAGIPTASKFDQLITTKGVQSKQRTKYMYQLAGERITGIKEETYQNANMLRGVELEAEARSAYTLITGKEVEPVGLCYPDEKKLVGASPDGLINPDGGIEIKCPTMAVHVGYLLDNKVPTDYFQQLQGAMYVTGRKWWDFVSYYPGMKLLIVRMHRDEGFIAALEFELNLLCKEIPIIVEKIK